MRRASGWTGPATRWFLSAWHLVRARPRTAAAVAAAILLLGLWVRVRSAGGTETAVVRRGSLASVVEVRGVLRAVDSDRLGPPQVPRMWNFKIAMMAEEGDVVKKGAPVLGFDTSDLMRELDAKLAESGTALAQMEKQRDQLEVQRRDTDLKMAQAESSLRKAEMKLDVPPELKSANELKEARLDRETSGLQLKSLAVTRSGEEVSAKADLASLDQSRRRAEARVGEIRAAIARMSVQSPRDGTVIYIANEEGEKKKIGDMCWVGEKVLEVADLRKMMAEGEVDESDSGKLAAGQRVTLRLDAHPDAEFAGRIDSVWQALQPKSSTNPLKVVKADIGLDQTDTRRMMPGMRFAGKVETERARGALLIPPGAVLETPEGPRARVRGLFGWRTAALVLGRRTRETVEVLSGLAEGDRVSLAGTVEAGP